jgi:hypothetical protein
MKPIHEIPGRRKEREAQFDHSREIRDLAFAVSSIANAIRSSA